MQIKVGTDICSIKRIAKVYSRFGAQFIERILTPTEAEYVLSSQQHLLQRLAARFAAKEAASKALDLSLQGATWREIEITKKNSGLPLLKLHGRALTCANSLGLTHFEVSLAHEKDFAIAYVLAYGTDFIKSNSTTQVEQRISN